LGLLHDNSDAQKTQKGREKMIVEMGEGLIIGGIIVVIFYLSLAHLFSQLTKQKENI
jgi:hypothetical protein